MMKMTLEDVAKLAQETATSVWGPRDPIKIIEKLKEEVGELSQAASKAETYPAASNKLDVIKEFGDVLFCLVRFADQLNIDPTDALAMTIVKIQERDKFGIANGKEEEATR